MNVCCVAALLHRCTDALLAAARAEKPRKPDPTHGCSPMAIDGPLPPALEIELESHGSHLSSNDLPPRS
jgi:hypothetical protein